MSATTPRAWSLLGKHPSRADFVRVNLTSEAAIDFHRLLELGVELLSRQRQPLDLEPVRFVFASQEGQTVLVGGLRASADSVGRQFPLAAFLEVPAGDLPSKLSEVPFYGAGALDAVASLLSARATSLDPLEPELQALPLPGPDAAAAASAQAAQALAAVTVGALQEIVSIPPAIGGAWYAVKTVLLAGEARRKALRDAPTLECPLSRDFGAAAWLSIVEKANAGLPLPSALWTASRLYVGFGALPAAIFPGLAGRPVQASRVWPASTSQQAAIDSARASLRAAPLLASPEALLVDALSALGARR
jgi:type VI secretion system ImpM family protein